MALGVHRARRRSRRGRGPAAPHGRSLAFLIPAASCVPATLAAPGDVTLTRAEIQTFTAPSASPPPTFRARLLLPVGDQAPVANAAIPVAAGPIPPAGSFVFSARTPLDQMRSIDCLAQAVYYEARSEGDAGERAVAQVVLNRVRHPAWPNSVCGVVYQGPMRAGGGLPVHLHLRRFAALRADRRRPGTKRGGSPPKRSAAAPSTRSASTTHYHTNAVFPAWAPRLAQDECDRRPHLLPPARPRRRSGRVRRRLCGQRAAPPPAMTLVARPGAGYSGARRQLRRARHRPRQADAAAVRHPPGPALGGEQPPRSDGPRGACPIRSVARRRARRRDRPPSRSASAAPRPWPAPVCRPIPSSAAAAAALPPNGAALGDPDGPRRAAGEIALIVQRALAGEAGASGGDATGERDGDAVPGQARDHRRLVADPVAAGRRVVGAPAIGNARHRLPLRSASCPRSARRAAAPRRSARRAAPRACRPCARGVTGEAEIGRRRPPAASSPA